MSFWKVPEHFVDTYIYIYIYIYRLPYEVVVVGGTTVLRAIMRESYRGRSLFSRNFGDSSEIVSVMS